MALLDNQWSFNGVTCGFSTAYHTASMTGFRDMPNIRAVDLPKVTHPGVYSGLDIIEGRVLTVQLYVVGVSAADLETKLAAFETATAPLTTGVLNLAFKLPGKAASHYGARPRRRSGTILPTYSRFWTQLTCEFFAPDPTLLDGE